MCVFACVCVMQIENVHGLIAAAASRSSSSHLDHVFELIKKVCMYVCMFVCFCRVLTMIAVVRVPDHAA